MFPIEQIKLFKKLFQGIRQHKKNVWILWQFSKKKKPIFFCTLIYRRPKMANKGNNSNSGRSYAGQNSHRGPALPPNNHDGDNWSSTHSRKISGSGRGNADPKGGKK